MVILHLFFFFYETKQTNKQALYFVNLIKTDEEVNVVIDG